MIPLKKVVAPFLFPIPLILEILLLGFILLWFTRRQKAAKVVVSSGILLLALLSYRTVPQFLLTPLETRYPPLLDPRTLMNPGREDPRPLKWVLVLGGGHSPDSRLPVTSRLSEPSLARLIEGIRIHGQLPGSKLILSGGSLFTPTSDARGMADLALALGTDERDIVLESASLDTEDQAANVRKIVGSDRFILVTSAVHMPRAMAFMREQGLRPIPAPTDHRVKAKHSISPGDFFPSASALWDSQRAFYEYLGLTWMKVKGLGGWL